MNTKPHTKSRFGLMTAIGAAAVSFLAPVTQAQVILNGDFELGVTESWTNNGGTSEATTPIGGDHSARLAFQTAGNLQQTPGSAFSDWTLSFDLALSDPGSSASRSFQLNLPHSGGGNINMRIVQGTPEAGVGTVQFFNGSSWALGAADAVNFSSAEDSLTVNSVTLTGNYSGTASYDLTVNGNTAAGLAHWQSGAPAPGATLSTVIFETGNLAGGSWAVVDNVSVIPEPGTYAVFLGLAGLAFVAVRRRR